MDDILVAGGLLNAFPWTPSHVRCPSPSAIARYQAVAREQGAGDGALYVVVWRALGSGELVAMPAHTLECAAFNAAYLESEGVPVHEVRPATEAEVEAKRKGGG